MGIYQYRLCLIKLQNKVLPVNGDQFLETISKLAEYIDNHHTRNYSTALEYLVKESTLFQRHCLQNPRFIELLSIP